MAKIEWTGWRDLDNKVNPKVDPCPLCGESQHRPEKHPSWIRKFMFGPGGIIGLGIVLFMGMSVKNPFDVWGEFEPIVNAYIEKYFSQTNERPVPNTLKRYTHARVNLRKGPGTHFKVVSQLPAGERVQIRESKDKWVEVYKDGQGLGFVYASLLRPVPLTLSESQQLLHTASWGDFRNAKKFKLVKPRETVFAIWEPILAYAVKTQYPRSGTLANNPDAFIQKIYGQEKLRVEYDELWVWEGESSLTKEKKEHLKGPLDIYRLYWLKGKVQAHIIGKFYERNPANGVKLSPPIHKIWKISDRTRILKELKL